MVLDLFSGIGGFSLGLERTGGFETAAFCEIEPFPRKVLAKHWPDTPIAGDIRKLSYNYETKSLIYDGKIIYVGTISLICGGYPCQPFSNAGKRRGKEDDRHLWPEFMRLVAELRPSWVIGENVAGHVSMGLDDVLSDLESEGYACRTFIIPACAKDAKHRRDRVWTLATDSTGLPSPKQKRKHSRPQKFGRSRANRLASGEIVADAKGQQSIPADNTREPRGAGNTEQSKLGRSCGGVSIPDAISKRGCGGDTNGENAKDAWERSASAGDDQRRMGRWNAEPDVGRVVNGVPGRVDRLKALGNAVVPQIPEEIGRAILETERNHYDQSFN